MIPGCHKRREYLTSERLAAYAFHTGRPIEVDTRAGLQIVKANSGIELVAPIPCQQVA